MGTRFYFAAMDVAPVSPAFNAAWEQTATARRGRLRTYPAGHTTPGTAQYPFGAKSVATTPYDVLAYQCVSNPLPAAGTLSGTFTCAINLWESVDLDSILQVVVSVVSNDGSTLRGTAYAGQTNTTVSTTLNAQNEELGTGFTSVRGFFGVSLSSTAYQANDRIVVDVGLRATSASSNSGPIGTANLHDDARFPEMWDYAPYNYSSGGSGYWFNRSWIEFSQDLFGSTSLAAEEFKYTDEGVVLNSSPSLPFVDILKVDGLDSADVRQTGHDREGIHGAYQSAEFNTSRTITLEGNIYASASSIESYLSTLKANFQPGPADRKFWFGTDAGVRFCWGKSTGLRYSKDSFRRLGMVPFQVQIVCQDPRQYSGISLVRTQITSTTSGAMVDLASIGGDRDTPCVITWEGPTSGITANEPVFELMNKFGHLYISPATGVALVGNKDVRFIDLDKHASFNYSISTRFNITVAGSWVNLAAEGNRYVFKHTSGPAINASFWYRPAYF